MPTFAIFSLEFEHRGLLKRIAAEVDPYLEITEICARVLAADGPALLFEKPKATFRYRCSAISSERPSAWPSRWARIRSKPCAMSKVCSRSQGARTAQRAQGCVAEHASAGDAGDEHVTEGGFVGAVPGDGLGRRGRRPRSAADADVLAGRCAALITWGLTVTRGPHKSRQNLGIYRQQVIGAQQGDHALAARIVAARSIFATMRSRIRGRRFRSPWRWAADPATILGAVTPVPDYAVGVPVCGPVARRAHRNRRSASTHAPAGARRRRRSCSKAHLARMPSDPQRLRDGARRSVRRSHRLLQRGRAFSGADDRRASPCAATRSTTPPTRASRRMSRRCWAWRSTKFRADAAKAVSGNRRLLSAARGLLAIAWRCVR